MDSPLTAGLNNLVDCLRFAAVHRLGKIILYPTDNIKNPLFAQEISYDELWVTAEANAGRLRQMTGNREAFQLGVVVLHFENAIDSITWYWSVLLAGGIPCMSSPGVLNDNREEWRKHLNHICRILEQPLFLTSKSLLSAFDCRDENPTIVSIAIEDLQARSAPAGRPKLDKKSPSDIAALMFTSGTSGNSKAVPLTHSQILASFHGKAESAALRHPDSPFLSWVGMDHVANLVHCHLFAIVSGVSQVQVPAAAILEDPIGLLNLWSRHRVSRTYAPNFLFAKLLRQLKSGETSNLDQNLNLEALFLDTGGEANVIEVCRELQSIFSQYGAPNDVFKPSFGMTETCAGCIFNLKCPSYDTSKQHDFASLGRPMSGLQVRIACLDTTTAYTSSFSSEANTGETGHLELKGQVIFQGYFNNDKATAQSFTSDGWFRTGDLGYLDAGGNLHLAGRDDDLINVNGVKYLPHELDAALEQAHISGAEPTYYCCFSRKRDTTMDTGGITVLYLPNFEPGSDEARFDTQSSIARVISMRTRCWPYVLPLEAKDLPKSTLGKLSRSKLKVAFESGKFEEQQTLNDEAIRRHREKTRGEPETPQETTILDLVRKQLAPTDLSVNDSILSAGATSMDLIALKSKINQALQLPRAVELLDLLNYPTVRGIATRAAIMADSHSEYDPVITLQPHGSKPPLWLVHPGVGEVLVFINLARHITDRPVYAFRAKGFDKADDPFLSLSELFETYYRAMKKRQPAGPYAIAGYSFGGIVAFEVTKLLEAGGDEVRYCGSWNLPPHIKTRMRELVWEECVMHLFYFVELMEETEIYKHKEKLCDFERQGKRLEAIQYLRPLCNQARWEELGLTDEYYLNWVSIAHNMQGLAVDYDPEGTIKCMDIFVADPLTHIAKDRKSWISDRLAAWSDFVREDVHFHEVDGAHYTMLNAKYVDISRFAQTLRKVLATRLV